MCAPIFTITRIRSSLCSLGSSCLSAQSDWPSLRIWAWCLDFLAENWNLKRISMRVDSTRFCFDLQTTGSIFRNASIWCWTISLVFNSIFLPFSIFLFMSLRSLQIRAFWTQDLHFLYRLHKIIYAFQPHFCSSSCSTSSSDKEYPS